jgi:hypothetical protein
LQKYKSYKAKSRLEKISFANAAPLKISQEGNRNVHGGKKNDTTSRTRTPEGYTQNREEPSSFTSRASDGDQDCIKATARP